MASHAAEAGGRRVLIPLGLAAFVTSLDTSVTTVAAPSIQRDLGLTLSGLEWVATSYVLAFASLLLVGGRLTDLLGRRRVLQVGMWSFALASALVALAGSGPMILTGRILQGAAAALVLPSALAILAADVPEEDRHMGAGLYTIAIAGSLALGPFVGGAISQYLHWSYIFWLNLPIVAIASLAVRWAVPSVGLRGSVRARGRERLAHLDPAGLVLSCVVLSGVTFALVEGQQLGLTSPAVVGAVVLAALCLAGDVVVERRAAHPLIDLELIRHPVVAGGTGVQVLWGLGINGVFFFTSIFLQKVLGLSPSMAGLTFVPLAVALIVTVPLGARLAGIWGPHRIVGLGMLLVATGLVLVTLVGPGDGILDLCPGLVLLGVGSAFTTPMTSAILEVVPPARAGVVSAVVSVSREVSGVLGIALTGAVLAWRQSSALHGGATSSDAFLTGYRTGLLFGAVMALVGGFLATKTLRPGQEMLTDPYAGTEVTGKRTARQTAQPVRAGGPAEVRADSRADSRAGVAEIGTLAEDNGPLAVADLIIDVRDHVLAPQSPEGLLEEDDARSSRR
jgi:EmrB/QacA subfamily drug resistance transporter